MIISSTDEDVNQFPLIVTMKWLRNMQLSLKITSSLDLWNPKKLVCRGFKVSRSMISTIDLKIGLGGCLGGVRSKPDPTWPERGTQSICLKRVGSGRFPTRPSYKSLIQSRSLEREKPYLFHSAPIFLSKTLSLLARSLSPPCSLSPTLSPNDGDANADAAYLRRRRRPLPPPAAATFKKTLGAAASSRRLQKTLACFRFL